MQVDGAGDMDLRQAGNAELPPRRARKGMPLMPANPPTHSEATGVPPHPHPRRNETHKACNSNNMVVT